MRQVVCKYPVGGGGKQDWWPNRRVLQNRPSLTAMGAAFITAEVEPSR